MACAIFRTLIHREDEYLERRFGKPYMEYRARVNALLPIPRRCR
jgi:protein-S-isoprenylcysteine O-methyltransferase Ste14